jgi:hypothetical protein
MIWPEIIILSLAIILVGLIDSLRFSDRLKKKEKTSSQSNWKRWLSAFSKWK